MTEWWRKTNGQQGAQRELLRGDFQNLVLVSTPAVRNADQQYTAEWQDATDEKEPSRRAE